jgi:hypothetical protein
MAKTTKGQKTAKKRGRTLRVRVRTKPLFDQAAELKAFAKVVLTTLEGTEAERKLLEKFLVKMDDVQIAIEDACFAVGGGNPMFRDFKISG